MSSLILSDNFADSSILANIIPSSEDPAFPIERAFNANRRGRFWRSGGYWLVEAGKNTIIFNEGAGNFTATVPAIAYTTTAALHAALKTAFESSGAAGTYTFSTDATTLKTKVERTDGGTLNILWTDVSSADMAAMLGFTVDDSGSLTYIADLLTISSPNEWILMDMGIDTLPRHFIMIGKRNEAIPLSPGGVFKLQGNHTNPTSWATPAYEKILTYDDEAIMVTTPGSTGGLHTEALRYWRIEFNDQNPLGYVSIGAIFLGNELWNGLSDDGTDRKHQPQFPYQQTYRDPSVTVTSIGQETYTDALPQTSEHQLNFKFGSVTAQEAFEDFFRKVGRAKPFFVILDPNSVYSSRIQRKTLYCKFISEPTPSLFRPNLFEMTVNIREEL